MLQSQLATWKEISITPGKGAKPSLIMRDKYCEELADPHIFSNRQFVYQVDREVKLIPVKCFSWRLLNYTQLFASDSDYIFFALSVTQQLKLNSQINIVIKNFVVEISMQVYFLESFQKELNFSYITMRHIISWAVSRGLLLIDKNSFSRFWVW